MYARALALTSAFAALANAIPMAQHKRDIVWVTEVKQDIVTKPVTKTVWVDAAGASGAPPPAHYGHGGQNHWSGHKHQTTVESTIHVHPSQAPAPSSSSSSSEEVAPASYSEESSSSTYVAPTTSSSVYVAPTTSSSSVYVAPTSSSVYVAPTPSSSSIYVAPTPSSTYVAPTTSSSVYVAPTPSSTYIAPTSTYVAPSSSSAAPPAYSSSAPSSSGGLTYGPAAAGTTYTGDFTYYAVGMGACGQTSSESDKMVAISESIFDSYSAESGGNPNKNPVCGKMVNITAKNGEQYQAQVLDRCTGCAEADLDFPETFFNTLTDNGDGRVGGMSWEWA